MRDVESPICVLLSDDAEVIRRTVKNFLATEPAIKVLGEASNFREALSQSRALKPDVILLDLHMPDQLGFKPELIKSQFALQGSRALAMSLPIPNDDECKSLAESFGAAALLDKANLAIN
jgi:DNA-binding NarL/FixJ family response regulator